MDIGAAADGQRLSLLAGVLFVNAQQRLHQGAVRRNVVRRTHGPVLQLQTCGGAPGLNHLLHVLFRGADWRTAVKCAVQTGLGDLQLIEAEG